VLFFSSSSLTVSLSLSLSLSTRVSQTKRVSRREKEVYLLETKRGKKRKKERKNSLLFLFRVSKP